MRCLSERGGPGQLRSYSEQQVHVEVGRQGTLLYSRSDLKDGLVSLEYYT